MIPTSFWTIPSVLKGIGIDIHYRAGQHVTTSSIEDLMKICSQGSHIQISEYFKYSTLHKVYFEVKVRRGYGKDETKILRTALNFLESTLHTNKYAVSELHNSYEFTFFIVCPLLVAMNLYPMEIIARSGQYIGFRPNIYGDHYARLYKGSGRPVQERHLIIRPVPGYMGTFSDHVIQSPSPYARILPPRPNFLVVSGILYQVTGTSMIEEMIFEVDFSKLSCSNRLKMVSVLKSVNLENLYSHKMSRKALISREEDEKYLNLGWCHAVSSSLSSGKQVSFVQDILKNQGHATKSEELMSKYYHFHNVEVSPPVSERDLVSTPTILAEDRLRLLEEQIQSLTQICDTLRDTSQRTSSK